MLTNDTYLDYLKYEPLSGGLNSVQMRTTNPSGEHSVHHDYCASRVMQSEPHFQVQLGLFKGIIGALGDSVIFQPNFHPEYNFIEYV